MSPSWLLQNQDSVSHQRMSQCLVLDAKQLLNSETTESPKRGEGQEKGYTHGLGMLIKLTALWAYFLTQKTPAHPKRS